LSVGYLLRVFLPAFVAYGREQRTAPQPVASFELTLAEAPSGPLYLATRCKPVLTTTVACRSAGALALPY